MSLGSILLLLYGVVLVGAACFLLGRATASQAFRAAGRPHEPEMSEEQRRELRELRNFLQYDGFGQP